MLQAAALKLFDWEIKRAWSEVAQRPNERRKTLRKSKFSCNHEINRNWAYTSMSSDYSNCYLGGGAQVMVSDRAMAIISGSKVDPSSLWIVHIKCQQYLVLTKPKDRCLQSSQINLPLIGYDQLSRLRTFSDLWQAIATHVTESRKKLKLRVLRHLNLILAVCGC